jgi:hypothetical protein
MAEQHVPFSGTQEIASGSETSRSWSSQESLIKLFFCTRKTRTTRLRSVRKKTEKRRPFREIRVQKPTIVVLEKAVPQGGREFQGLV